MEEQSINPGQGMLVNRKFFWHWLFGILAILVLLIGVSVLVFEKSNQKPKYSATFSDTPMTSFPTDLAPTTGLTPQYWQDQQTVGAIFGVKEPLAKAVADYQKQLTADSWKILGMRTSDSFIDWSATNTKTGVKVSFEATVLPGNFTSIKISVQK